MVADPNRTLYKTADPNGEASRARRLAEQYGFSFVDLDHFQGDHQLFRDIPLDLMIRYQFLPEHREDGHIVIVVGDPTDVLKLDELELLLGAPLKVKVASPAAIREKLQKSESTQRVLDEATEGFRMQLVAENEDGEETLTIDSITQQDSSPIIKLVDSIVFNAIQRRASDIHIETRDNEVVVKYRIDGVLYEALEPIDKRHHTTIISRIKIMSELDIAEKRVPQDGRFKLRITGRTIDFRVSIVPTAHGEDSVIRILDKESMSKEFKNLRLDILGFDAGMLSRFRKFIKEPYGMVLVTGPTGSGKTTTLYAALSEIQSPEDKIITIEDPVEYQLRGITQIPVNEKKGLTFARGLRSILRHDPDKIMVGVLGRFLNMKVDLYNFVSALNCVLAQRLVRKICEHCKREMTYPDSVIVESGLDLAEFRGRTFYEGAGCIECNGTGFHGRAAISELLDLSDRIRTMILDRRPASEIKKAAHDEGMTFLRESALLKVKEGQTTLREINKVTFVE